MILVMKLLFSSLLILSILVLGMSQAYADVTISTASNSGAPGCEETANGCYLPKIATVGVGEVVVFSNTDTAAHTFTSGNPDKPETIQTLFDSSLVMAGSTYEWSPNEAGDVSYFCMVHPWMTGLIIVTDDGNTTPTEPKTDPTQKDNPLKIQNQKLQKEINELKLENIQLKNKIISLNSEIDDLKDQIISMTKEFVAALEQLTKWFGEQLSQN